MATIQLQTPQPFDFSRPDEWSRWKRRFEQFRYASGLSPESGQRQVSTLLYCLGQDADDVLRSTNIAEDKRKDYQEVMTKFDAFFGVRRNVIFERACFNRRTQQADESVEQYIAALYRLIETCDYGDLTDEMLCDRLVVGIRDTALSERLQMDPNLTLDKAMKSIRQREAVKEQHQQLQGGSKTSPIVVDEIRHASRGGTRCWGETVKDRPQKPKKSSRQRDQRPPKQDKPVNPCKRCGKGHLQGERCPARNASCFKCNRRVITVPNVCPSRLLLQA